MVAVKRKLQFYYWKNRKFLDLQPDINLPDVPRSLAWRKNAICIGYGSGYSLVKMGWLKLQTFPTFFKKISHKDFEAKIWALALDYSFLSYSNAL